MKPRTFLIPVFFIIAFCLSPLLWGLDIQFTLKRAGEEDERPYILFFGLEKKEIFTKLANGSITWEDLKSVATIAQTESGRLTQNEDQNTNKNDSNSWKQNILDDEGIKYILYDITYDDILSSLGLMDKFANTIKAINDLMPDDNKIDPAIVQVVTTGLKSIDEASSKCNQKGIQVSIKPNIPYETIGENIKAAVRTINAGLSIAGIFANDPEKSSKNTKYLNTLQDYLKKENDINKAKKLYEVAETFVFCCYGYHFKESSDDKKSNNNEKQGRYWTDPDYRSFLSRIELTRIINDEINGDIELTFQATDLILFSCARKGIFPVKIFDFS